MTNVMHGILDSVSRSHHRRPSSGASSRGVPRAAWVSGRPSVIVLDRCQTVFRSRMRANVTEAQLRRIYGETIDALYAYVSRRCGGVREVAEDIVQETWL